jgi:hypothetical protein
MFSSAVVKGAVLFGVSRDAFASRMLRYTYGISTNNRFDAANKIHTGLSPETYRTYMQNGSPVVYVTGMFQLFAAVRSLCRVPHRSCSKPESDYSETALYCILYI